MAKLIYSMVTSLDGHVEDDTGGIGWSAPDEQLNPYINERASSSGTCGSRIANSRAESRMEQRCAAADVRPTLTRA